MISSLKGGITKHWISIFLEMGRLRSLSTSNRKLWGSFILSQDPIFQKKIINFLLTMKGFDDTSEGIFELIFTSPSQPINYRFLLTKTRSQTTLDAKYRLHIEKIRR